MKKRKPLETDEWVFSVVTEIHAADDDNVRIVFEGTLSDLDAYGESDLYHALKEIERRFSSEKVGMDE